MASGSQAFYCLWQQERILEGIYERLSREDVCSLRLANSACCNLVTKRLFTRTNVTFTANSFTKASRVQALSRIGHHIQHLTFTFSHSEATFLPPLVHPMTGHEISFLYTPYTHMASSLSRPKYGNSGLGEILTQQYPPLFHSATNVPSFINALKHLPNMRHLTIRCPGQDPRERYRRDIVDYALISLRIAIERAPLDKLDRLTLSCVHPSAFTYLRHTPGFGCLPSASRRWRQIRKLYMQVDAWDFYGSSPGLDQLKIIEDYIRQMAPNLQKFAFTWLGRKGPCPIALAADPLFAPPRSSRKLFNEVTSPMSPLPPCPARPPISFPRLRHLTVRNATMTVTQAADLVSRHQGSARGFDFENVALIGGGSWDDALAPLYDRTSQRGSDAWSCHSLGAADAWGSERLYGMPTPPPSPPTQDGAIKLSSPSAAVSAASRELLDLDFVDLENFLGLKDGGGVRVLEDDARPSARATIIEEDEDEEDVLPWELAAAKAASYNLGAEPQRKRIRRRRDPRTREDDDTEAETRRHRHRRHHRNGHHDDSHGDDHDDDKANDKDGSHRLQRSRSAHGSTRRHRRLQRERPQTPPPLPLSPPQTPEVVLAEGDEVPCPKSPLSLRSLALSSPRSSPRPWTRSPRSPPTPSPPRRLNISAPMMQPREPPPSVVLLQPTVYDPSSPASSSSLPNRLFGAGDDDGLSPVQRNLEQEEAHRRLAEDADARASALQKAKAAVMSKLTREFCRTKAPPPGSSPAVRCAAETGRISSGNSGGGYPYPSTSSSGGLMGFRLREGLLGTKSSISIAHSHQSMDSNSTLVPLIISR